ncbi:hypothetical protein GCM10022414_14990 [Zhongshania borealis]|uniref:Uncharacterized protein n=1 Tax=Zhongshania borealis TaxID=889488 RepID=A0ABP7WMR0_9GAMM
MARPYGDQYLFSDFSEFKLALLTEFSGAVQSFINTVLVIVLRVNVVHYFGAPKDFGKNIML